MLWSMKSVACSLLILVFCAAGCGTSASGSRIDGPASAGSRSLPTDRYLALLHVSTDLGPVAPGQRVSALLTLAGGNTRALNARLAAMENPHSPLFGESLTPSRLARLYGPNPHMVRDGRLLLRRLGFATVWRPGNAWMLATAPAVRFERVFRLRIDRFRARNGVSFYANAQQPTLPRGLRAIVTAVGHISNYGWRVEWGNGPGGNGWSPGQLLSAYNLSPLRSMGLTGTGMTVAFIETDGFKQSDLDRFTAQWHLPTMHPAIKYGHPISRVDGETEMDMEVVHEIAPGAALSVYNCPGQCDDNQMLQTEDAAVRGTSGGIISISLGGCEADEGRTTAGAEASEYAKADVLGESVFVASGDNGAYTCLTRNWGAPPTTKYVGASTPATMPGVTAVGGTRLILSPTNGWQSEEVWEAPVQTEGSGGGISVYFGRPTWQRVGGVSSKGRNVPDVSAVADPNTSPAVVVAGSWTPGGGTSEAAPIWAGMTAMIDQYLMRAKEHKVGFLNPALYSFQAQRPAYPPFHDITVGSNLVDSAGPGYDRASGLGTPNGWNLTRDLATYMKGKK